MSSHLGGPSRRRDLSTGNSTMRSVRNKLFGGELRVSSLPRAGRGQNGRGFLFFGVSATRLAQRFVSGAWPCRMY